MIKWDFNFTVDKILLDLNYMRTIPPKIFRDLTIRSISFEGNPLNFVHPDAFASTTGISDLNFNECNLTAVPNIFKYLPDLQTLELLGNRIMTIEKGIFEPIRNLRYIDVANNLIEDLDFIVDRCSYRKTLTSIILTGNPLKCTCDAYELVKSKTVQLVDGVCATPRLFQGMYIGTGTAFDDDEDGRDTFSQYASRTCQDECGNDLMFDCVHSIWTNGADINCHKRPLCVTNKPQCPVGAIAGVVGSTDPVNYTEPDDDEDSDVVSKNRTRIKKRPTYLIEKMRFQHGDKSGASSPSRDPLSCLLIIFPAAYNILYRPNVY
jgi:hypothetical protein